jgi:hypothetical protein
MRLRDRIAPKRRDEWHGSLDGEPYTGEMAWTWNLNAPVKWEGDQFKGLLVIGHDERRWLFGRLPLRKRFVAQVVLQDGLDPMEFILLQPYQPEFGIEGSR